MTRQAKAGAPTDIGAIDTVAASDKGAPFELMHPTSSEPTGVFIVMLGKHGQVFRDIVKERTNARVKRDSMAARRGKYVEPRTAEEFEREAIELLAACTVGWYTEIRETKGKEVIVKETLPIMTFNGEAMPFSTANALKLYTERLWVREQADAAIGDLESFMKA